MRSLILAYILIGFATVSSAQRGNEEGNNDQVYSPDQSDYYFYLKSSGSQSLFWDTIYGRERCTVFIINNTGDSLLIGRVYNTSSYPVLWDIHDRSILYLPGDTITVISRIHRRHGSFNRPIQFSYRSSSNLNEQNWYLNTKGFFMDSIELKGNQELRRKKELEEIRLSNPDKKYYDNGQIKSRRNPNPENDSLPVYIEYYEDGLVKLEEFRGIGIRKRAYDYLGRITIEWDDEGLKTEYHPNGKVKYKEAKDRYSSTVPFRTYYFTNGCLKKEEYANQTITKEYDSLTCGKLISHNVIEEMEGRSRNGKVITHYNNGKVIGQTFQSYGKTKNEVKGEYLQGELINGTVSYYTAHGILLFENKIVNGKRDSVFTKDEKQGNQINLVDSKGNKTGLWITDKVNKQPILLPQDFSVTFDNTRNFDDHLYEYADGDTFALITFHEYGGIKWYSYIRDKQKRIDANLEYNLSFYPNGFIKNKFYQLKNGLLVSLRFSEEKENEVLSGTKGNLGKLIFKNNKLIEIHSEKEILEKLDSDSYEETGVRQTHLEEYCVEKGQFRNFELYNGFIYYYKKDGTLILTEKVMNGAIQGNPKVQFTEPKLTKAVLMNDLNFNGWTEQREVDKINVLNLWLTPEEIEEFKWSELKKCKNLSAVNVNARGYLMDNYVNYDSLKVAIKAGKGEKFERHRYSWEEPHKIIPELPGTPKILSKTIEVYPDTEPNFPGGYDSLIVWITNNIQYPTDTIIHGKVYVSFVVETDGSIEDIQIVKSLHPSYDNEVKRLMRSMPKWTPGLQRGEAVKSKMNLPVTFKL